MPINGAVAVRATLAQQFLTPASGGRSFNASFATASLVESLEDGRRDA
jgi:hypothetical protein